MDLLQMGAQLLSQKLVLNIDTDTIASALGGLLANESGQVDLAGLATKMASSGNLSAVLGSWLGDGANQSISADSIMDLFGSDRVGAFASKVGVDTGTAADGLAVGWEARHLGHPATT